MTGVRLRLARRVEQPGVQTTALLSAGRGEAGGSGPQARRSLATHWATRSPGGELIEQSFFPETPDQSHEYRRGAAGRGAVASDALLRARSPHASPPTAERETRGRGFFAVPVSLASGCFSELRKQTRFPDTQRINGDGGARTFVNKEALLKY